MIEKTNMITKKIPSTEIDIIRNIISKVSKYKNEWDDVDPKTKEIKPIQTLKVEDWLEMIFNNDSKEVTITYNKTKIPKIPLKHINAYFRIQDETITVDEFVEMPMFKSCYRGNNYVIHKNYGMIYRKSIANKIQKQLLKLGIKKFTFTDSNSQKNRVEDDLELCLDLSYEDSSQVIKDNELSSLAKTDIKFYTEEYDLPITKHTYIKWLINGTSHNVGIYMPERNIVVLFFNPFFENCFKNLDYEDNEAFTTLFDKLLNSLKELKIKKCDSSQERERITLESFLQNLKSTKSDLESKQNKYRRDIDTYQQKLINVYNLKAVVDSRLVLLSLGLENMRKTLMEELKSIRKLKIIENVRLKDGRIEVEYIPSSIIVPNYSVASSSKNFGKREIYIGRIIAKIGPSNIIWDTKDIYTVNGSEYVHPHVNSRNSHGCFGSGDGAKLVSELLGTGKYAELVRYLWMWIKTCRDGSGYSMSELYYNENLKRGFPVWDEKGIRIVINDPVRIKSGEQMKLEPYKDMEKTLKTFEKYKR